MRDLLSELAPIAGGPEEDELIIDCFAGGGGASHGMFRALGRHPDVAVNHDREALAMHRVNHPETLHVSRNMYQVDPIDYVGRRRVGLLWASPDCKHFSKAKGSRPVKRNIRDLAWTVITWAKRVRPRVIILENVEEFRDWCPVVPDGEGNYRPCPDRIGQTFKEWVRALKRLGYKVEWRELRACDYGTPTIRKRLFVMARRDGVPIVWPDATHGAAVDPDVISGKKLPWRTAAEIIDWSLPCPSIFDSSEQIKEKFGLRAKRPLAEATMCRIARGVQRYVLDAKKPFLVSVAHGDSGGRREYGLDEPLGAVSATNGHAVVAPVISYAQQGEGNRSADQPLHTVTASAKDQNCIIAPSLVNVANSKTTGRAPNVWPVEEPLRTVTSSGGAAVVASTLIQTGFGERKGQAPRVPGLDKPIGVQMAGGAKHALVSAFLAKHNTGATGAPLSDPAPTITANGVSKRPGGAAPIGLVAAHMVSMRGSDGRDAPADEPVRTESAGGTHNAVAACYLDRQFTRSTGADIADPCPTLTAGGDGKANLVAAFLDNYYGAGQAQPVSAPMATDTTRDRRSLVTVEIDGHTYAIVDIGMRMLSARERFRAQGIPDSYIIDTGIDEDGNTIKITRTAQGRMCGNSVCPPLAEALVKANVPEMAVERMAA